MKHRTIILGLIISFFNTLGFSQSDTTKSIYYRAIKDLIEYRTDKGINKTIYLDSELSIMVDMMNDKIEELNVVLISQDNQKSLYKSNNNSLSHTTISPLKIINGKLKITITPYHGKLKNGKYNLLVSDGYNLFYEYDCNSGIYKLAEIEAWGI